MYKTSFLHIPLQCKFAHNVNLKFYSPSEDCELVQPCSDRLLPQQKHPVFIAHEPPSQTYNHINIY